ncbi:Uncharacterised protein [Mycobacteroides abscessus]|nr:Uncharacterised protein [Mycobacteroides abscessus]
MAQYKVEAPRIASRIHGGRPHHAHRGGQIVANQSQRLKSATQAPGPSCRRLAVPADVERNTLWSNRFGIGIGVPEAVELPVVTSGAIGGPQRAHHRDGFVGCAAPAVKITAARLDLLTHPSDARADPQPPATEPVQGGQTFGQHHGVVIG